ncbi:hypothetical protein QN277_019673 [Acacia crassicarpa]|uniref:Uncharacterized protein n=1 Tax=Acacia crassicarpa TaxID=499986 RepID=A0AAE1MR98_9FABA|nr:hypothetical protein QN277_019673 [Acacia crassicarpa]
MVYNKEMRRCLGGVLCSICTMAST